MSSAGFRSYYGRPVLKPPVWKPVVAWYLFAGGLAGASASLSLAARVAGNRVLARNALYAALAGAVASPALLIEDLGRPRRFLNMLRVVKPTSPMNMGTWLLVAFGNATGAAATSEALDIFPLAGTAAHAASGLLGLPVATYTGALLADTAVPVWHEARRTLPLAFAGGAAASAGAAAQIATRPELAGPARRLAVAGAALELAATQAMETGLGPLLGEPYKHGRAGALARAGKSLTLAGAAVTGLAGRRRAGAVAGGALLLAGAVCARFAVFHAGRQSAEDPRYTVLPQRERIEGATRL